MMLHKGWPLVTSSAFLLAVTTLASPVSAVPIRLDYTVTDLGGGLFEYEFFLIVDDNDGTFVPGQMWDWLTFGDQESARSNLTDFSGDLDDLPIGPWTAYFTSFGFHNGPTLLAFPNPGWIPGFIGDSLNWSGTSTANLGQGELLWSTLITEGGANPANFTVANLIPSGVVASVDIKPGSCPNSYNRNSHGVLPVALLGTANFDVNDVDLGSLLLVLKDGDGDGDPGSVAPNFGPPGPHPTIDDVATPFTGEDQCDCHELTGDGIDDLMLHFRTDDVVANLDLNDFAPGAFVSLTLVGELNDGTLFEADDCVRLVPPGIPLGLLAVTSNLPGAWIDLTPPDNTIDQGGFANFVRNYPLTTEVTLTAPSAQLGWVFVGWNLVTATGPFGSKSPVETGDAVDPLIRSRSITLPIESALEVVEAVYEPGTMPEPGDGPDPSNAPPTSHRRDDGIDDGPNDPTDDPPSSPGVPRR